MSEQEIGVPRWTWAEVWARRLERHGLSGPARVARPAGVVAAMCGAHAQVMSAGEHSVALRMAGATRADVREALWTERSLVKTYGPRGTVHLLPARDLAMWTGALAAIPRAGSGFAEGVRLTPEQVDAVVAVIGDALLDAELTVEELDEAVVAGAGAWAGELVIPAFNGFWPRWRQVVPAAANRGALCFGPNRGQRVTYASPRRWLAGVRPVDGEVALAGLVRSYLWAYGPATPRQMARWLAAAPGWMAGLFARLTDDLEEVDVEGDRGWIWAGDTAMPDAPPRGVRLLPYFDAYAVGCYPRERLFPGRASERALAGSQAGNFPVLLVDGTVAGVWHGRRSGRRIEVTVEPLIELTAARRRELEAQVERVGEILEASPRLTIGTVTVGAHA